MEYKERRIEEDIEHFLLTFGGYTKGDLKTYDRERAIDMDKLIEFIKKTQPKQWKRYLRNYQDEAEKRLYRRFNEEVEMHGLLHVIRNGIHDRGVRLQVAYFKPESTLNPDVIYRYNQNILTCTRQFKFSPHTNESIDMVLSLNGIPIIAIELKNQLTGQSVKNGEAQFSRRNTREKCFQFNTRFLAYFAVDLYEVYMTTHLKGQNTYFLPFNQGSNGAGEVGGAGNPENLHGYSVSYLWEKVLTKDVLMDILQKYMHLEIKSATVMKNGKEVNKTSKKLIFPRYHQLDVVRKLLKDVREIGSGKNYLIQHSAGSGKSNSIAWLAYGLANLHDKGDKPIFNSVIIISDRRVLDRQLQDTVASFDHTPGVVETIGKDKTSQDLKDAINDGKKIIVTTIQKFPVIYEDIDEVKGKRFAVIADEAHQSQTGRSARAVREALADTEEALREFAEIEGREEAELEDGEDRLVRELISQGRHSNMSFFAFTATPKKRTLELFGERQEDGTFKAFHNYSMRQAIEEEFILDVLRNYMTYRTCYRIAKETEDNPKVPPSPATKTIRRFASLHPHNLQQKTAIIIEQFREVTRNKIDGRGKAMVVTASRLHAIRYYHEFKRYIEFHGYDDVDILVAFSDVIRDGGEEYSEEKVNIRENGTSIKEQQLPAEFASDNYNVLVVAEKYQTGFDEPLLHTMFVDKKLSGVKAVQTLSRLNRTHPEKVDTFILDFINTKEEIEKAFQPYYESTILDEEVNVNLIYNTRTFLRDFRLYGDEDIEKFANIYYKKGKQTETELGKIASLLKPIVARYTELDEEERYNFKVKLKNFIKWYSYITQIVRMYDKDLHKEHVFAIYLEKLLPRATEKNVDLEDKIKLEFYKLEKTFYGDIVLDSSGEYLGHTEPKPDNKPLTEDELLDEIIQRINERYKGEFTDGDRVIYETIRKEAKRGETGKNLKRYVKNNDYEMFIKSIYPEMFRRIAQECYMRSVESFTKLFEDKEFYRLMMEETGRQMYEELKNT